MGRKGGWGYTVTFRTSLRSCPTETQNVSNKHAFWTTLDRATGEVPQREQLFVVMDTNARTGRRKKSGMGSKNNRIPGAYGQDTLNDNGELLLFL